MHGMAYWGKVFKDKDKWRLFCRGQPLMGLPGGNWHWRNRSIDMNLSGLTRYVFLRAVA